MTCTRCHATTATGIHLCHDCATDLERTLDQIPDTLAEARTTIARLDSTGGLSAAADSGPGSPINLTASQVSTTLWESVVSWSRWVLAEDQRAERQPTEPVAYLRASVGIIRGHDWAGDLAEELIEHHHDLILVIDRPPEIVTLGQCGATVHDGRRCTGTIRDIGYTGTARCRECSATYDSAAVMAGKIDSAWHIHGTLSEVVRALQAMGEPIKLDTAKKWVTRGVLTSDGKRPDGVALFTPAQVRKAMTRAARRLTA